MNEWGNFLSAMTLALVRVSSMVAFAPFFSSTALPMRAKAVFVGAVAWLVAPLVATLPNAQTTLSFAAIVGELAVGLVYGLSLTLLSEMLIFAGQIAGLQFSFSLVNLLDPESAIQTPLLGDLFQLLGTLVLITAGLDRILLASVVRSFRVVPLGTYALAPLTALAIVCAAGGIFLAALELAAPVLACTMLVEIAVALVAAALGREMDGRGSPREGHRHRIPLGLVLLEQGWITNNDLRAALIAQKDAGAGRLGSWLVRNQSASEEQVTRALGLQWGCPVLGMEFHHPEGLTALVPRLFVDAFGALPLRVAAGKILYLGFEDHLDPALALAVERMTGLQVEGGLVQESAFRPAHNRLLEARFPAAELIEAATEAALSAAFAKTVERSRPVESRLVRVHDCLWLRMWLRPQSRPVPEIGSIRDLIGSARSH
jgi:flagellar biosynthetic protein FliR